VKSQEEYEQDQKYYENKKEELRKIFAVLDKNHDGTIDEQEVFEYLVNNN
jgi:Ca2+-binding EF-hand superfamily protein